MNSKGNNHIIMAIWESTNQLMCQPHLSGELLFPDRAVFFAQPAKKSGSAVTGDGEGLTMEQKRAQGTKVDDLTASTSDVLKDIMTADASDALKKKLLKLRAENKINPLLYVQAEKLVGGGFYDRKLVEKLLENPDNPRDFQRMRQLLYPTSGSNAERNRGQKLAEGVVAGSISDEVFGKASGCIEVGTEEQMEQLDAMLKNPTKDAQQALLSYFEEHPLARALADARGAPALSQVRDNLNRQLSVYKSEEAHTLFTKNADTKESIEKLQSANKEFAETSNEHNKIFDSILTDFERDIGDDDNLSRSFGAMLSNAMPSALQKDERDITFGQLEASLKFSDVTHKTNLQEKISPEMLRVIHQKLVRCQELQRKALAAKEAIEEEMAEKEKHVRELQEMQEEINLATNASGLTLKPGTKIRYRKETLSPDRSHTTYQWAEAEIEGVFPTTLEDGSVEGEPEATYQALMVHIEGTEEREFTLSEFPKWANNHQVSPIIETQKELEKDIGFDIIGQELKAGMELAQETVSSEGERGVMLHKIRDITADGRVIMDEAVPYLVEGNTISDIPLRETAKKQQFTLGEFARWVRRFRIMPHLKKAAEAEGAYNKIKAEKNRPSEVSFQKGSFLTYGPYEQYNILYVNDVHTDENGEQIVEVNGESFKASELLRTAKNQNWEPLDLVAYATRATVHIMNPMQRIEVYNRTVAGLLRRQAILAHSLGDVTAANQLHARALATDPKNTPDTLEKFIGLNQQPQAVASAAGHAPAAPAHGPTTAAGAHGASGAAHEPSHGGGGGSGGSGGHGGGTPPSGPHGPDDGHGGGTQPVPHEGAHTDGADAKKHDDAHEKKDGHDEHDEHDTAHDKEEEAHDKEIFMPVIKDIIKPHDHAGDAKLEKKLLKQKEKIDSGVYKPDQGALMQLWEETHFLSGQEMWQLAKHVWEYWERTWERKMKGRFSKFGANLPYIGTEMLRIKEETEHHEVGTYKEAISAMGIIEIRGILNISSNADQIKACLETLVDKGHMRWDDVRTWEAMNRIPGLKNEFRIPIPNDGKPNTPVGIDEKTGKLEYGVDYFGRAIDSLWGDAIFQGWQSKNAGAYESGMDSFNGAADELENDPYNAGKVSGRLKQLLKDQQAEKWVSPQEYEGYLRFIIKNGKGSIEDKMFYIVAGIATRILPLERLGAMTSKMSNNIPFLDFLSDTGSNKPFQPKGREGGYTIEEFTKMAEWFLNDPSITSDKDKFGPGNRVKQFLWKYGLTHPKTQVRTLKAMRNAESNIDHDDAHTIVPLLDDEWAVLACGNSAGSKKYFTIAGYLNGYPGFSEWMKTLANSDEPGSTEKLVQSIKAFAKYDGVLSSRFRKDKDNLMRLSVDNMRGPSVVDGQPVMYHQTQLQDMMRRIGRAYGIEADTNMMFEETPNFANSKDDKEKQSKIENAFNNYGKVLEGAIAKDGPDKLLNIVKEAELMGYDYEVNADKREAAKKRAAKMEEEAKNAEEAAKKPQQF